MYACTSLPCAKFIKGFKETMNNSNKRHPFTQLLFQNMIANHHRVHKLIRHQRNRRRRHHTNQVRQQASVQSRQAFRSTHHTNIPAITSTLSPHNPKSFCTTTSHSVAAFANGSLGAGMSASTRKTSKWLRRKALFCSPANNRKANENQRCFC